MNELNKEIRTLELNILDRKNTENEMRKTIDLVKLRIKNSLDPKDKAYSNDEKREAYALEQIELSSIMKDFFNFEYETKVMEIELRYKLRELDILVHYLRQELI